MNLKPPFDTFRLEKPAGTHKDFGLPIDSSYPLKGVTYPVDYGDIEGYVAEDGANLDVFVGKIAGFIKVARPNTKEGEHKFYLNVTDEEEKAILGAFAAVVIGHGRFETNDDLLEAIEPFRQPSQD